MTNIETLHKAFFLAKIKIDYVVQHSYNPISNNSIQFYAYQKNNLKYIITTYRDDSKTKIESQNLIISKMLTNIKSNKVKESVVFSDWTIKNGNQYFRIQKYIPFKKLKLNKQSNFKIVLDKSIIWINEFQSETHFENNLNIIDLKVQIKEYFSTIKTTYSFINKLNELIEFLENKIHCLTTDMPLVNLHGDFFYGNYFLDLEDNFKVFDWEFANIKDWVVKDFFSNLIGFIELNNLFNSFFNPSSEKEIILSKILFNFQQYYDFKTGEIKFYLVYICILNLFREERHFNQQKSNQIEQLFNQLTTNF